MRNKEHLSIEDAIENLSNIADLSEEDKLSITEHYSIILERADLTERTIQLLDEQETDHTITAVKETFRVVLQYIRQLYKKEIGELSTDKNLEGIKSIMVLVGDAAVKLDKYTSLFKGIYAGRTISEMKEYKQIQQFYRAKIAAEVNEEKVLEEL
ncbi:MAG: hypothetical protein ACI8RA_002115, partial [Chlamydiales bacterium]